MRFKVSVPYGDHVCLNRNVHPFNTDEVDVSVPYGDHVCLNGIKDVNSRIKRIQFPSPMGIMSVSISPAPKYQRFSLQFPSPMGIMSVSIGIGEFTVSQAGVFPSPMGIMSVSI